MTAAEKRAEWMHYWSGFLSTVLLFILALAPTMRANVSVIILMLLQEVRVVLIIIPASSLVADEEYSSLYHSIIGYVIYQAACITFCSFVGCNLVK